MAAASIHLHRGDLTTFDGDAIVNAANNHLVLGAGVAGAIRTKGGPTIQQECDEIGTIRVGEAAITGAGNLPCRFVIHAAAMGDEPVSDRSLCGATRNSLLRAEENGCRSIAFPAIGTGIGGFSTERCAGLMAKVVREYIAQDRGVVEEVHFFLFAEKDFETFTRSFAEHRE
jgi:O-acetyl-ADP-ribose deacetylase (regulator of RNase III)